MPISLLNVPACDRTLRANTSAAVQSFASALLESTAGAQVMTAYHGRCATGEARRQRRTFGRASRAGRVL